MATRSTLQYLVAAVCLYHSFDTASATAGVRESDGCLHPASFPAYERAGTSELSINSPAGGGDRKFRLFTPEGCARIEPAPLILAFHGKGQNASAMQSQTQFSNPELNNDTIVVYPQGVNKQWSGDPEAPPTNEINDIEFANDLLDYIEQSYCIDTNRVYAAGFSNGGGLTDLLACDAKVSARLAAVAIASGAFYKDGALKEPLFSHCTPSHVLPIMEFHGSKDPVEHYDGKTTPDGESYALPEWAEEWAVRNGCENGEQNRTVKLFNGNVEKSTWSCGQNEGIVTHYYIHGFGHGWPSTVPLENDYQRYGPTYLNATPVIMDFFSKHTLFPGHIDHARTRDEL